MDEDTEIDFDDQILITELRQLIDDHTDPPDADINIRPCHLSDGPESEQPSADIFSDVHWETDLESEDEDDGGDDDYGFYAQSLYIKVCQKLDVVPNSYFMRHIDEQEINLRHYGVSGIEIKSISKVLQNLLSIEKLHLDDNCLDESGCKFLCETLETNQTLKELNIGNNGLRNKSLVPISRMVALNVTLEKLSLCSNQFDDNGASTIAELIEDSKLKSLDLSNNRLGSKGGSLIAPSLGINVYLEVLNLSWNHIRGTGAVAIAKSIKDNVKLVECDFSWNGFGEEGGVAIADALMSNSSLKLLNISHNRLNFSAAAKFAKMLLVNDSLEVLQLGTNPIKTNGCVAVAEAVYKSKTSSLRCLDLKDNPVEFEFLSVIKLIRRKKPLFEVYHGSILRAGNTTEDIGKPAIDIVRLSRTKAMVVKGQITINNINAFEELLAKAGITTQTCTADQLIRIIQEMNSDINILELAAAVAKLPKADADKILISEILT